MHCIESNLTVFKYDLLLISYFIRKDKSIQQQAFQGKPVALTSCKVPKCALAQNEDLAVEQTVNDIESKKREDLTSLGSDDSGEPHFTFKI